MTGKSSLLRSRSAGEVPAYPTHRLTAVRTMSPLPRASNNSAELLRKERRDLPRRPFEVRISSETSQRFHTFASGEADDASLG
jgi:hypothetical protein